MPRWIESILFHRYSVQRMQPPLATILKATGLTLRQMSLEFVFKYPIHTVEMVCVVFQTSVTPQQRSYLISITTFYCEIPQVLKPQQSMIVEMVNSLQLKLSRFRSNYCKLGNENATYCDIEISCLMVINFISNRTRGVNLFATK